MRSRRLSSTRWKCSARPDARSAADGFAVKDSVRGGGCSRRPSCSSCRALSDFSLHPATLVLGILLAASDIDTVAIVGICVQVHDVAVLGSAHDPIRRYRPKILLRLRRIRQTHVKPRRHQHPLRISYLESLDRRACHTEEHRYGDELSFWQEREVMQHLGYSTLPTRMAYSHAERSDRFRGHRREPNQLRRTPYEPRTAAISGPPTTWPTFGAVPEVSFSGWHAQARYAHGSHPPPSARNTLTWASAIAALEAASAVSAVARLASALSTSRTPVRPNRNSLRAWSLDLAALSRACFSSQLCSISRT